MPWKGQTVEQRREEFVARVLAGAASKAALCREYGISRPTGDKWLARHSAGEGMGDRSRRPFRTPNRIDGAVEAAIVALRRERPAIGAKKLKKMLENQGIAAPAHSTVNAVLHRHGLITKEASAAAKPHIRFEMPVPNRLWQMDFKGHFAMNDAARCHPLTVVDDHSRFCVGLDAHANERFPGVRDSLKRTFEQYGLPDAVLCDNGNPWGTSQSTGYSQCEVWLMDLGILVKHGRIRHPQTQGKNERFNGSLLRECIKERVCDNLPDAQKIFDDYRHFYNHRRPHHALDLNTPAARYSPSNRALPSVIPEWDYGQNAFVRKVKSSGYLTFRGQGYFLSESLADRPVAVIEDAKDLFLVLYRQFCIAKLSVDNRHLIAKSAFIHTPTVT